MDTTEKPISIAAIIPFFFTGNRLITIPEQTAKMPNKIAKYRVCVTPISLILITEAAI
ncbi:hypothetical protein SDC9_188474 [bioreactor metagenome]|uniref:Uncharacterized protein n=1 Tax=bioreactor metagenome TaxID=1076179 RepID=A0A645HXN9_9ZZZZ